MNARQEFEIRNGQQDSTHYIMKLRVEAWTGKYTENMSTTMTKNWRYFTLM